MRKTMATLTVAEAAKFRGVSRQTIYTAVDDGLLVPVSRRRGAQVLFLLETVRAWVPRPRGRPRKVNQGHGKGG